MKKGIRVPYMRFTKVENWEKIRTSSPDTLGRIWFCKFKYVTRTEALLIAMMNTLTLYLNFEFPLRLTNVPMKYVCTWQKNSNNNDIVIARYGPFYTVEWNLKLLFAQKQPMYRLTSSWWSEKASISHANRYDNNLVDLYSFFLRLW